MQPPTSEAYSENACAKTFAPTDRTFGSSVCDMSESVSCITSSPLSNVASFPVPSRCSTPCQDEHPALPLFPKFDSPFSPFSPLPSTQPSLQDLIDEPEVAQEAPVTSSLSGITDAELQAAVDSILPDVVPSTPEQVTDFYCSPGPSPMIGSGTDAECDQHLAMQTASGQGNQPESEAPRTDPSPAQNEYPVPVTSSDSAGDILSQAVNMAEIPQTREFLAWEFPPTGPADPRYFLWSPQHGGKFSPCPPQQ